MFCLIKSVDFILGRLQLYFEVAWKSVTLQQEMKLSLDRSRLDFSTWFRYWKYQDGLSICSFNTVISKASRLLSCSHVVFIPLHLLLVCDITQRCNATCVVQHVNFIHVFVCLCIGGYGNARIDSQDLFLLPAFSGIDFLCCINLVRSTLLN